MTGRPTPTRGALRVCRGVVLAGTSAALAIAAHAVALGGLPDAGLTLLCMAVVAAAGMVLAGRRRSIWAILAVLGAAQLVMHVLMSLDMTDMAGMAGSGLPYNGATMLLAHTVAVVVTAAMLFHADDAMFFVASVIARLVPTIVIAPPPAPGVPARLRPARAPVVRAAAALLCRANARRGPPVVA
jgi:hypothetical protein